MFDLPDSPNDLGGWLAKRGFSKQVVDKLLANNVDGDTFIKFTRADLNDIYPDSFLTRKQLWDFLEYLRHQGEAFSSPDQAMSVRETPPQAWPSGILDTDDENLSLTYSPPPSTISDSTYASSHGQFSVQSNNRKRKSPSSSTSTVTGCSLSSKQSQEKLTDPPVSKLQKTFAIKIENKSNSNEENTEQFLDKFDFPLGSEVKQYVKTNTELDEKVRKKFIRDCVTCLQVATSDKDGKISTQEFKLASQKICAAVPTLKDKKPPSWEKSMPFPYWSSVMFMLRKRYNNIKYTSGQAKKKVKDDTDEDLQSYPSDNEKDDEQHLKEINRELKKKEPNWKALQELQSLSFKQRKDFISTLDGRCVVKTVLEKFPFLNHQQMLLNELELHIMQITKKKQTVNDFRQNFKVIAPYFCEEDEDDPGQTLEAMQSTFALKQPFLLFIPEDAQDPDDFVKNANISNSPTLSAFYCDEKDESQLFIVIDKEIKITLISSDYFVGFLVLLSVFYSFNLAYDKEATLFFKFFEKHVLGIEPKKVTVSLKRMENRIFHSSKN